MARLRQVGTINYDYRSLYLHFECNVLLYQCESIHDIKADFDELETLCARVPMRGSGALKESLKRSCDLSLHCFKKEAENAKALTQSKL